MKLFNIFLVTLCIYFVICLVNADDIIEGDENQENQTEPPSPSESTPASSSSEDDKTTEPEVKKTPQLDSATVAVSCEEHHSSKSHSNQNQNRPRPQTTSARPPVQYFSSQTNKIRDLNEMYNHDPFLQEFKPIPWWTLYYKPVVEKLVPLYAAQKQQDPQTQVQDIWSLWNSAQNPPYQQNPSYQQNVPYQSNPTNQRPQMNAQNPGTLCTSNYYDQNQNCNPDPYYPQTQYTPYVQTQYQQTQYPLVQPQVYSQNQVMSQSQYPSMQPQNSAFGQNKVLPQNQYSSMETQNLHYGQSQNQYPSIVPPNPTQYQVQENEILQESDVYRPDIGGQKQQFHHLAKCLGAFEVYSHCLGHCDRTCDGSDRMPTPCSADICIAGCNCISGYSRDEDGHCIETGKCKKNEDKEGKGPTKIVVAVMKKDRS